MNDISMGICIQKICSENPFRKSIQKIRSENLYRKSVQKIRSENPFRKSVQKVRSEIPYRNSFQKIRSELFRIIQETWFYSENAQSFWSIRKNNLFHLPKKHELSMKLSINYEKKAWSKLDSEKVHDYKNMFTIPCLINKKFW